MCKGKCFQAHAHTRTTQTKLDKGVEKQLIPCLRSKGLSVTAQNSKGAQMLDTGPWRREAQEKPWDSSTRGWYKGCQKDPETGTHPQYPERGWLLRGMCGDWGKQSEEETEISHFLQPSGLLEPVYIGKPNKEADKGDLQILKLRTKEQDRQGC